MVPLRPSMMRGSMMIGASLVMAGLLTILTSIVIARSVEAEEFGVYSVTVSLQSVVVIFSGFSIGVATSKYLAEYRIRNPGEVPELLRSGFWLVLPISLVTACAYFILADPIGTGLYGEHAVAELVPLSALVVFSSALLTYTVGIAQGSHHIRLLALMQVMVPAVSLSVVFVLVTHVGVRAAFVGLFLGQSVIVLSVALSLRREGLFPKITAGPSPNSDHRRKIISFALPAVIGSVMVAPLFWFGNTVLAIESGFVAAGHFAVALVFFHALSLLPNSLSIPLVPRFSEMSVHSREQIGVLVSRTLRTVSVVFFPLFFAVVLFSREFVGLLYGAEYYASSESVSLIAVAGFCYSMTTSVGASIVGLGRMWVGLGLNALWATTFTVMILITVPAWGPIGLGAAFAVSYGVHLVSSIIVSNGVLHVSLSGVSSRLMSSVAVLSIGFIVVVLMGVESCTAKIVLWTLGTGLMVYLGRNESKTVIDRIFSHQ